VANHSEKPGGAVPPLTSVQLRRAMEPGNTFPTRSVQLLRCQRFSRLCVLMNPILPGLRSIRTKPAKCLKLNLLWTGLFRGTQEVNLRVLVRAIWSGVRSVDEPAHADIHRRA
jgi:hypothetical protein